MKFNEIFAGRKIYLDVDLDTVWESTKMHNVIKV